MVSILSFMLLGSGLFIAAVWLCAYVCVHTSGVVRLRRARVRDKVQAPAGGRSTIATVIRSIRSAGKVRVRAWLDTWSESDMLCAHARGTVRLRRARARDQIQAPAGGRNTIATIIVIVLLKYTVSHTNLFEQW
jgi:hypothetical protein